MSNATSHTSHSGLVPCLGPEQEDRVNEIARCMSRYSQDLESPLNSTPTANGLHRSATRSPESYTTLQVEKGSIFDPFAPNFDSLAWAQRFIAVYRGDPDHNSLRSCGVAFRNVNVHGFGSDHQYQSTVGNLPLSLLGILRSHLSPGARRKVSILKDFIGVVEQGEMLVVLGPPGSGCSTFLKTIAGEMNGIHLEPDAQINYQGIRARDMHKIYRGEAIYCAEVESNFPALTVGDTLQFAAECRCPEVVPGGTDRKAFATHLRDVVMAILGISHTVNSKVGSDYIRGVSGGERKRVSIAEVMLADAPLQCWDNSTRGLDSATSIEFCKSLRMATEMGKSAAAVAIYQAPQSAYELFDKVTIIYEGEQIYFGASGLAKNFFEDMGFEIRPGQSTPDFLTSLTNPAERRVRSGFELRVPRTPSEFASRWKASEEYIQLVSSVDSYNERYPRDGPASKVFAASRRGQQFKHTRAQSPYILSYTEQVKLCLRRSFWRIASEPYQPVLELANNVVMALMFSSIFYNLPETTATFEQKTSLIFLAMLIIAFASALEILTLYAQRPIVEKHARYAFYHPSAEAFASFISSLPYKMINAIVTSLIFYLLPNLNRQTGNFFFFLLLAFICTLVMSVFFRSVAALSRSMIQAMVPAGILIIAMVTFSGFVLPKKNMRGWSEWIYFINPLSYAFEAFMINEFSGRIFPCSTLVPSGFGYSREVSQGITCSTIGASPGEMIVRGDDYIGTLYGYAASHKWRNLGIMLSFTAGFFVINILASEYITARPSKGEVLVWPRGYTFAETTAIETGAEDEESRHTSSLPGDRMETSEGTGHALQQLPRQANFSWSDVCYDIKIKGKDRRILDMVDGWVKPGQLTALMGVSGAGKTTLLDLLATRITMGVVSGEMLVDGAPQDDSFQRKTGYVQQQDVHLPTSTVREALRFSALLRRPFSIARKEKLAYVEEILQLLDMMSYADAVVGIPGEGLNVEQRKRLTIGVELVAKPDLLLFLDEPTSGLDSQTSWAICSLLEKLSRSGQAILCTIHQPSAQLFERFDRLLFLAKGGQTVYFGEVGRGSRTLIDYFTSHGAAPCSKEANPAEWMLQVIGAAPGTQTDVDWPRVWRDSAAKREVKAELRRMKVSGDGGQIGSLIKSNVESGTFAASYSTQFIEVTKRVARFYWRNPAYIYSKLVLVVATGLFIGFSFCKTSEISRQEIQNQILSMFVLFVIFGQMVEQTLPEFISQRALYEVRERQSRTYSWTMLLIANIIVETLVNIVIAILLFIVWYYPIALNENAALTGTTNERGGLMLSYVIVFVVYTGTFAYLVMAPLTLPEAGGAVANLIYIPALVFCGVLATKDSLPGFWKFMYYVSPFTYLAEGMLVTGLANVPVTCSNEELLSILPPSGRSCAEYMDGFINTQGGYIIEIQAAGQCSYCPISSSNDVLSGFNMRYQNRWRNIGILCAYIIFNVVATFVLYYTFRVPKTKRKPSPPRESGKSKAELNITATD